MYDVDKSGKISKEEGTGMIKFVLISISISPFLAL